MNRTPVTESERAEMQRLRLGGMFIADIAKSFGRSSSAVSAAVEGVLPSRFAEDPDEIAAVLRMRDESRTRAEIAKAIGKTPDQVKHLLKRLKDRASNPKPVRQKPVYENPQRSLSLQMSTDHRKNGTFRAGNRARQAGERPADGQLQMRVDLPRKGRWVQVARSQGMSLSEWVGQTLDDACNAPASAPQTPCSSPE